MKNYLVTKNYTISDHTKWYMDRTKEYNLVANYTTMGHILCETARQHLVDLDDIIVHRGEAENIAEVFKVHFKEIYDLWSSEQCNILYCDLDVIFLKKAAFFGQYDFFAMFNYTEPHCLTDEYYRVTFDCYLNCGIRYYPHTMKQETWDIGFKMLENWNYNSWDTEQVIYNQMLWSQNLPMNLFYKPYLAFQMLEPTPLDQYNTNFNRMDIRQAAIVHIHGSRDSGDRLKTMKQLMHGKFE